MVLTSGWARSSWFHGSGGAKPQDQGFRRPLSSREGLGQGLQRGLGQGAPAGGGPVSHTEGWGQGPNSGEEGWERGAQLTS